MDLSLDALCEDLQSCFDPDPEATARATNLVAVQVGDVQLATTEPHFGIMTFSAGGGDCFE